MYCHKCGEEVDKSKSTCPKCGSDIYQSSYNSFKEEEINSNIFCSKCGKEFKSENSFLLSKPLKLNILLIIFFGFIGSLNNKENSKKYFLVCPSCFVKNTQKRRLIFILVGLLIISSLVTIGILDIVQNDGVIANLSKILFVGAGVFAFLFLVPILLLNSTIKRAKNILK